MPKYDVKTAGGDVTWYTADRFGMIIHFGLYAATGRHEWIKTLEEIPEDSYRRYFDHFDPDLLDMDEWAAKAKAAGMKYAVLTAKHHEGFCLFDSEYTDYKSTNTPCGRDLVREFTDAFRRAGLRVGLYYSLIDWHHPDFQIDTFHPLRNHPDAEEMNRKRSMERYRRYLFSQVEELLTNYGRIDILWFDFTYSSYEEMDNAFNRPMLACKKPWMDWTTKDSWHAEELIAMVREKMPGILINDRTGIPQDFKTPEQTMPDEWPRDKETGERIAWEACHTFSGAWGYARDEMSWKDPQKLLTLLAESVSKGGNLIMNVGPTARGCFDRRADRALGVYADWMRKMSRSIYGCTMADPYFTAPKGTLLTEKADDTRLYVHIVNYPYEEIVLSDPEERVVYAQMLEDASEVPLVRQTNGLHLQIPKIKPENTLSVIELFLRV